MHFFSLQKIAGHRETIFMMHFDFILTYLSVKIYLRGYDLIMQLGQARLGPPTEQV